MLPALKLPRKIRPGPPRAQGNPKCARQRRFARWILRLMFRPSRRRRRSRLLSRHRCGHPDVRSNALERRLLKLESAPDVRDAAASNCRNRTPGEHGRQIEANLVDQRTIKSFPQHARASFEEDACNATPPKIL